MPVNKHRFPNSLLFAIVAATAPSLCASNYVMRCPKSPKRFDCPIKANFRVKPKKSKKKEKIKKKLKKSKT
jgi:hypothetical protein